MITAGWLLVLDRGAASGVRRALSGIKGVECRMDTDETLVVVTETTGERAALDDARTLLGGTAGVRSADLVAVFEDEDPQPKRRGRRPAVAEVEEA